MVNIRNALLNPAEEFVNPEAILNHPKLSLEQKIKILKQWEYDMRELSVAEEENMRGGDSNNNMLQQINKALYKLGVKDDEDASTTKHG